MNITYLIENVATYLLRAQRRIDPTDLQSLRNVSDEAISRLEVLGSFRMSKLKVRERIMVSFAGECITEKQWRSFTKWLVGMIGQPKQRDPAAIRAELIDSVADDLNSAQVQSVVEGGANRRRLESVAGDSFVPILRRLEGPLLTNEQWKEFLFRIPYR